MSSLSWLLEDFVDCFREALLALLFDLGGIAAGALLYAYLSSAGRVVPFVLLLYPGILSVRGVINGIFAGNLSTGLHLGTVEPSLREPSDRLKELCVLVTTLTLLGGSLIAALVLLVGLSILPMFPSVALDILLATLATMDISLLIVPPLTVVVAFYSFRVGLDPDKILYPVMSTLADLIVTGCYAGVIGWLYTPAGRALLVGFTAVFTTAQPALLYLYVRERFFKEQLRECVATILLVTLISSLTGLFLEKIGHAIGMQSGIYAVYPALIDTVGDVGSIVGSVASTRLHMGELEPSLRMMLSSGGTVLGAWAASLVLFLVYSLVAAAMTGQLSVGAFTAMAKLLLASNVLAIAVIVTVALAVAILTFKVGLNPDNFVNPVVSTVADAVATAALYLSPVWLTP